MKWGQCALTPHPIFVRDLCLKCVSEVASGNNLTNRPLVGRNTKRFSDYSLNLFVLSECIDKYRYGRL